MPLNKTDLAMLRKQYPAAHYDIKEQGGKLEVVPKKCVIRMFKHQLKKIKRDAPLDGYTVGEGLDAKIKDSKLSPTDFEQCQVTIEKKVADLLTAEAKNCKTRKIIYLQQLLGNATSVSYDRRNSKKEFQGLGGSK